MEINLLMSTIWNYLNLSLLAYGISTISFIIGTLFLKRLSRLKLEYLNVANTLGLILALTTTLVTSVRYYYNREEEATDVSLFSYRLHLYAQILFCGVIPLIFLSKRLRTNIPATIIAIVSSCSFVFYERIYIWVTSFFSDYLSSNWTGYNLHTQFPYVLGATITYFAVVFLIASKTLINEQENRA